jgi:hypothetical protein
MGRIGACLVLLTAAVAATLSAPAGSVAAPGAVCGSKSYTYAGLRSESRAHGVRAELAMLASPLVRNGHVAAWVGVGGVGEGPNRSNAWLQVGYSAFQGSGAGSIYYEVARPGAPPVYTEVRAGVKANERHRVAVLEIDRRPGWWRVWVDGEPVSEPIRLRGSHKRWRATATAESWNGGTRACNEFRYAFRRLALSRHAGGSWRPFRSAYSFRDSGLSLARGQAGFVAGANR